MNSPFTDADRLDLQHHSQIIGHHLKMDLTAGLRYIQTGQSMHEGQRRELYKIEDFATFDEWLHARHDIKLAQANDYITVRDFPVALVQDRYLTLEYLVMIRGKLEELWPGLIQLVHEQSRDHLATAVEAALHIQVHCHDWALAEQVLLDVGRTGKKPAYDKPPKSPVELARTAMHQVDGAGKTVVKIRDYKAAGKPLRGGWQKSLLGRARAFLSMVEALVEETDPVPSSEKRHLSRDENTPEDRPLSDDRQADSIGLGTTRPPKKEPPASPPEEGPAKPPTEQPAATVTTPAQKQPENQTEAQPENQTAAPKGTVQLTHAQVNQMMVQAVTDSLDAEEKKQLEEHLYKLGSCGARSEKLTGGR